MGHQVFSFFNILSSLSSHDSSDLSCGPLGASTPKARGTTGSVLVTVVVCVYLNFLRADVSVGTILQIHILILRSFSFCISGFCFCFFFFWVKQKTIAAEFVQMLFLCVGLGVFKSYEIIKISLKYLPFVIQQ